MRLTPLPTAFASTRDALHRVATHVLTPARYRVEGRIGLRAIPGGFGTPPFGDDTQVRVEGVDLVVDSRGEVERRRLTTLRDAALLALGGPPDLEWAKVLDLHDPPAPADPDAALDVDEEAAACLATWFEFGWTALETLRADDGSVDASAVQLWPEHFDAAFECGSEAERRRAGYGFSPGDAAIPEPYVYVSLWFPDDAAGDLWNATTFRGAVLTYGEVAAASDPGDAVLAWLRERRDVLGGGDDSRREAGS